MNTQGADSGVIEQAILFFTPKSNNYEKQKGARRCKKHEGNPEKSQLQENCRCNRKENGRNKTRQRFSTGYQYAFTTLQVLLLRTGFVMHCTFNVNPGMKIFQDSFPDSVNNSLHRL
jgi:hypothetical protein